MPDLIYQPATVLTALRDWIDEQMPATITVPDGAGGITTLPLTGYADTIPETARAPFWLLEEIPGGGLAATGMGWEDLASLAVQITSHGVTIPNTRVMADLLRWRIAGRSRRGAFATAMELPGVAVVNRESQRTGRLDVVNGRPQWSETYRITYGRA